MEGDLVFLGVFLEHYAISIHALWVEGDIQQLQQMIHTDAFLSTPSGWRATKTAAQSAATNAISIHALRVEGDYRSTSNGASHE